MLEKSFDTLIPYLQRVKNPIQNSSLYHESVPNYARVAARSGNILVPVGKTW